MNIKKYYHYINNKHPKWQKIFVFAHTIWGTQDSDWYKVQTKFYNNEQNKKDIKRMNLEKKRIKYWINKLLIPEKDFNSKEEANIISWLSGDKIWEIRENE